MTPTGCVVERLGVDHDQAVHGAAGIIGNYRHAGKFLSGGGP
jgi:hypothetical protein